MSTIFYAYIPNISDDNTWRFMITFGNRSIADQWWRAMSDAPDSYLFQRISPQFYTHDPNHGANLNDFFKDARYQPISRPFRGKMFFTLLDDRGGRHLSVVPPQEITDHISGKWFYIRSKAHPAMYWCDGPDGVYLSDEHRKRTRFQITGRNIPVGTVMIGTDQVTLQTTPHLGVDVTDNTGILVATGTPQEFRFDDLENGLFSVTEKWALFYNVLGPRKESWELV